MRRLASGEHVWVVRKAMVDHGLLNAFRDGSEVMGFCVQRA
jgi:hypothetical protein